jgi:hypothetical protein
LPLFVVGGTLGLFEKMLRPVEVAKVKLHLRLGETQCRAGFHDVDREHREPTLHDHTLSAAEGLVHVLLDQLHRPARVS